MALQTKAAARVLIQQLIDDPAGKLWSPTALDTLIEGALDELWGDLLDTFPWLRSVESALLTPVAPGTIDKDAALTRFYRVQYIVRNSTALTLMDQKDSLVAGGVQIAADADTYTVMGNLIWMFPLSTAANVYVRYSNFPPAFGTLGESDPVVWPDGFHMAYIYDIASRALEKGDEEDSSQFGKRSEASLFRLKAFLRKQQIGPTFPWTDQDSLELGSVT